MTLGLTRSRLASGIQYELRRISNMDSRTADKIAAAVAEAIYKNNRQLERQLTDAGVAV